MSTDRKLFRERGCGMLWDEKRKPATMSLRGGLKGDKHYGGSYQQASLQANTQGRAEKTAARWRFAARQRHAAWAVRLRVRGGDRHNPRQEPPSHPAIQSRRWTARRNGASTVADNLGGRRTRFALHEVRETLRHRARTGSRTWGLFGTRTHFSREDFRRGGWLPKDREDGRTRDSRERAAQKRRQGLFESPRDSRTAGPHMTHICEPPTYDPHITHIIQCHCHCQCHKHVMCTSLHYNRLRRRHVTALDSRHRHKGISTPCTRYTATSGGGGEGLLLLRGFGARAKKKGSRKN